jgi:molecular chaperone DnaK
VSARSRSRTRTLGTFELSGIAPAPRGVPQIEVTFDIDANGIVHVTAKDRGTGKEQKITISGGSALSKEEIERMVKDAEAHAEEDKKRREETEARNLGESLVFSTEKFLAESGDKVDAELRAPVDEALADLKEAIKADSGASKSRTSTPRSTPQRGKSQKMGAAMYAAQAEAGDAADSESAESSEAPAGIRQRRRHRRRRGGRGRRGHQVTARHNHHGDEASAEPGGRDEFDHAAEERRRTMR